MPWENAGPSGGAGTVVKLTGLAFGAAYIVHRGTSLRLDAVGPWVWGFVAWACASLLWTAQPAAVTDEVLTLVQLFIVTILVADLMADRPETAEPVMWTYVFSATITSFIGLYMYAVNHSSLPDGRAEAFIGQTRAAVRHDPPAGCDHADLALAPPADRVGHGRSARREPGHRPVRDPQRLGRRSWPRSCSACCRGSRPVGASC